MSGEGKIRGCSNAALCDAVQVQGKNEMHVYCASFRRGPAGPLTIFSP